MPCSSMKMEVPAWLIVCSSITVETMVFMQVMSWIQASGMPKLHNSLLFMLALLLHVVLENVRCVDAWSSEFRSEEVQV